MKTIDVTNKLEEMKRRLAEIESQRRALKAEHRWLKRRIAEVEEFVTTLQQEED